MIVLVIVAAIGVAIFSLSDSKPQHSVGGALTESKHPLSKEDQLALTPLSGTWQESSTGDQFNFKIIEERERIGESLVIEVSKSRSISWGRGKLEFSRRRWKGRMSAIFTKDTRRIERSAGVELVIRSFDEIEMRTEQIIWDSKGNETRRADVTIPLKRTTQ